MRKEIKDALFILLMVGAAVAGIYMAVTIKDERNAYDELFEDYMQLHNDYAEIKVHYDALLDKVWSDHNSRMKEQTE